MSKFKILERLGWKIKCPNCSGVILYTFITDNDPPMPFFYANDSNDILLRKSDKEEIDEYFSKIYPEVPKIEELEKIFDDIISNAPKTLNGGEYELWSYVKCPNCQCELEYNKGVKKIFTRIYEPKTIIIDGANLIGDSKEESWTAKIKVKT